MSPLHLEILLYYYTRPDDYPFEGNETRERYAANLVEQELLRPVLQKTSDCPRFDVTGRGTALINHMLNLPLPRQKWVMEQP